MLLFMLLFFLLFFTGLCAASCLLTVAPTPSVSDDATLDESNSVKELSTSSVKTETDCENGSDRSSASQEALEDRTQNDETGGDASIEMIAKELPV